VLNVTSLEDHRRPSRRSDAQPRRVEDLDICINAYDPALRTDEFGQEQCNVTRTATKIKNPPHGDERRRNHSTVRCIASVCCVVWNGPNTRSDFEASDMKGRSNW
jgi:hypothetical protein